MQKSCVIQDEVVLRRGDIFQKDKPSRHMMNVP